MIIEKNGKKYIKIGDKAVEFDDYDKNGKPVIKPKIIKTKNKNGGTDIRIEIPALQIRIKQQ